MAIKIVPDGTKQLPRHQFKNLELEEIALPEGLELIGAHCFRLSKLRRVVLPSTVKTIEFGAFSACDELEEVILPQGIRKIGAYAFSECEKLEKVSAPDSPSIGEGAFYEYRRNHGFCPWCGTELEKNGLCPNENRHAHSWSGSLRLYRGLFWWNGNNLITVKVHCIQTGKAAYSVRAFGKRDVLGSHMEEWQLLREQGSPAVKGHARYDDFPRGRVEISNFTARVFLHPLLQQAEIRRRIIMEFGLSEEIQGLTDIRFITDYSEHYHTNSEKHH